MTVSYLHKEGEKEYSCMYMHRLKEKFKINNQWFKRNDTNEIKQKQRKQRLRRGNTTKRNKRGREQEKVEDKNKTV